MLLGISTTSPGLLVVGGLLTLYQTFTGAVAKSRMLVAAIAFVGTLT